MAIWLIKSVCNHPAQHCSVCVRGEGVGGILLLLLLFVCFVVSPSRYIYTFFLYSSYHAPILSMEANYKLFSSICDIVPSIRVYTLCYLFFNILCFLYFYNI